MFNLRFFFKHTAAVPTMVENVIIDKQKKKRKINVIVSRELQCEYKQVYIHQLQQYTIHQNCR